MKRTTQTLQTIILILLSLTTVFGAGELDTSFNASAYGLTNGTVHVIKRQPDGKYLVGGNFTDVNGVSAMGLTRLNANLTVDASFNPADFGNGSGLGGTVYALGIQSDGKIIVAGDIFGANNVYNPGVKRLFPDGTIDTSFQAPHVQGTTYYDLEVLPNDKILIGGLRLNPDGTADETFTNSVTGSKQVEVLPDGKILWGNVNLARYNPDGTLDGAFTTVTTDGTIETLVSQADGKILIGGTFTTVNSFQQGRISRINTNGSLDLTFNQNMLGFNGPVYEIIIKPDGKLLVGGAFSAYNTVTRQRIAQLIADGSLDASFQNNPVLTGFAANDIEILPDGKLLVGFSQAATYDSLLRFNADGTLDNTFTAVVSRGDRVRRIAQQPDGKIIIVGTFRYVNGQIRRSVARLNIDGSLDQSFVPYFTSVFTLTAVALQPDGKILVGGFQGPVLVRLNQDGTQDTSFSTQLFSSSVYDVAVLPDGKILVVGDLAGGKIRRLNPDGSSDNTFTVPQINNTVYKLAVQSDGKIVIGGAFTQIGISLRGRIARLNADGTLDNVFNPPGGANGDVYNLDLQAGGKIVIGGAFSAINGAGNQNRVGKFNADGSLDTSFVQAQAINSSVVGLRVQPDGKVIVCGNFNLVGSTPKLGIARFNADGSLDSTFNPYINNAIPSASGAQEIYLQTDGKVLVGGEFTKMNGVSRVRIARLLNATVPPQKFFDYDGDGRADISVFRPSENKWFILRSSDLGITQQIFALAGDVPVPADYDGDGRTDIAIFRPSSGDWWYLSSINNAQINVNWGQAGDVPRPADFDGDGKTDFIVYRPSNSAWYRLGSSGATSILAFGIAEDKPLIGDFDGDGKSDVAVFRPSTGDWWYAASAQGGQFRVVHWGAAGDVPAPADYDGDGKTDFAVFRPSEGGWYVLNSSNGSATTLSFGLNGDKPVPADYDGDGKADIAVFRPSNGTWYLLQSGAGFGAAQWGTATDLPTENVFLP